MYKYQMGLGENLMKGKREIHRYVYTNIHERIYMPTYKECTGINWLMYWGGRGIEFKIKDVIRGTVSSVKSALRMEFNV